MRVLLIWFVVGAPEGMKRFAILDVETVAASDADDDDAGTTKLPEPRRLLVEGDDNAPSKPENSSVAGQDSPGNKRPIFVIFESHMCWYRASSSPDVAACSSPSAPRGRFGVAPTPAALTQVSCMLSH